MNELGSFDEFDVNWKETSEAHYIHWTRGPVQNQIQLAFRNHFEVFQQIIARPLKGLNVLEVGCGRGSLSAYFADAGSNCMLLDQSATAIDLAKNIFEANSLPADFCVGDALDLSQHYNKYDLVFSIGVLEHFASTRSVLLEQYKTLRPGGVFIGYVVPEFTDNIQKYFTLTNKLLAKIYGEKQKEKEDVFRTDLGSEHYLKEMADIGFANCSSSGIYSLPMISNSPEFPFTLLPADLEEILVCEFENMLDTRRQANPRIHPWLCTEGEGNAFIIVGHKSN